MLLSQIRILTTSAFFLNVGNGTFSSQTFYSASSSPSGVTIVDVNNDNKPDIIVANSVSNNVGVLLNTGAGIFLNQIIYSTGSMPRTVAVFDMNNDNYPDIIVTNTGSSNVGVLLNTGNGHVSSSNNLLNFLWSIWSSSCRCE